MNDHIAKLKELAEIETTMTLRAYMFYVYPLKPQFWQPMPVGFVSPLGADYVSPVTFENKVEL